MAGTTEKKIESVALATPVFVRPDGRARPMVVWVGRVAAVVALLYLATFTVGLLGVSWVPPVHIPFLDAALPTPNRAPSLGDDAVAVETRSASPSGDVTRSLIVPTSDATPVPQFGVDEDVAPLIDPAPTAATPPADDSGPASSQPDPTTTTGFPDPSASIAGDIAPASSQPNPTTTASPAPTTSEQLSPEATVSATTPSTAYEVPPSPATPEGATTVPPRGPPDAPPRGPPDTSRMHPATPNTTPPHANTGGAPSDTRPSKP